MATKGFGSRRPPEETEKRLPPGQTVTDGFPVMTAGFTPEIRPENWTFTLKNGPRPIKTWDWASFNALPQTKWAGDIHCVTHWTKLDTVWEGVTLDALLADAGVEPPSEYTLANCEEGYSTNVPLADLIGGKSMVATRFGGQPLPRDHGGPARLLVPHLYFWKSAKWIRSLQFTKRDEAGFWELRGYHIYGDPWHEQRFS
ncbi:MAG: molybdopterin-dependent oxidoreductase [Methylocystis sp.]